MEGGAVAEDLIKALEDTLEQTGSSRVKGVTVRLGILTGISPDSFAERFGELANGTVCEGADVVVEETYPGVWCMECGTSVAESGPDTTCPDCGSDSIERLTGTEIEVVSLDVD